MWSVLRLYCIVLYVDDGVVVVVCVVWRYLVHTEYAYIFEDERY